MYRHLYLVCVVAEQSGSHQLPQGGEAWGIEEDQVASSFINDPAHWHHRAAQMRALAEGMSSSETRDIMIRIAIDYERLAARAEQHGNGTSGPKSDGDGTGG